MIFEQMQRRFEEAQAVPLFKTDAEGMWELYLQSFEDPVERQHHNCHACKRFIERFGNLVTINERGMKTSAIWDLGEEAEEYSNTFYALSIAAERGKIVAPFYCADRIWGDPVTGIWTHFAVRPKNIFVARSESAGQRMAAKRHDFETLTRALGQFSREHINTALLLLRSDSLYRSEKVLGAAEWLANLHTAIAPLKGAQRSNRIWLAVATAPAGFCRPRSGMIGTLLEDIAAGKSFEEVSAAFSAKMHPLRYQRPQAAPSAGAIDVAEKLVDKLGVRASLRRRFATVEEVKPHAIWLPRNNKSNEQSSRLFDHLRAEQSPTLTTTTARITWRKFAEEVLPNAHRLRITVPASGAFTVLTTAVDPESPPILQWDSAQQRNPVSWYLWHGGSRAEQHRLQAHQLRDVEAVLLSPHQWCADPLPHFEKRALFLLAGAGETRQPGLALFPETLKAELHGIRAVIEAHSKRSEMDLSAHAAVGLSFGQHRAGQPIHIVASVDKHSFQFSLDRWD